MAYDLYSIEIETYSEQVYDEIMMFLNQHRNLEVYTEDLRTWNDGTRQYRTSIYEVAHAEETNSDPIS